MQVVNDAAKSNRRRYASETPAQDFAEHRCRELWSQPFDHPDPVDRPPSPDEMEVLRDGWRPAHRAYEHGPLYEKAQRYEEAVLHFARAVESDPGHAMALERLGVAAYGGRGTTQCHLRSIELLSSAVRLDPSSFLQHLSRAWARETEPRA